MPMISRRVFLAGTAGCGAVAALPGGAVRASAPMSGTEMWRRALGQGAAVRDLGLHCLRSGAVEKRVEDLVDHLGAAVAARGWSADSGAPGLRGALRRLQKADFDAGNVVRVEGWILARNEARGYALAALLAGGRVARS